MNQLFYEAIVKEKEREIAKYVEYNRIKKNLGIPLQISENLPRKARMC